ncbi:uncharacterized protein N7458_009124 [Penicillium daleae]|uniref:Uncharacterized protein n=1 Tax=Penicillium daleae TaxID=63821 RepID=A0AAD6BYK7_9EURO|nr:uncharacterized protein N7458_009124 [Penicillium daleae]KAJ5438126.1 hypothetical protein N7458_009124 [Penicillium daleae]
MKILTDVYPLEVAGRTVRLLNFLVLYTAILSSEKELYRGCGRRSPAKRRYTEFCGRCTIDLAKIYFLHGAREIRYMLNKELGRAMIIDFHRSILKRRPTLQRPRASKRRLRQLEIVDAKRLRVT